MSNFHPLEVVGRNSEIQLQVGENYFFSVALQRLTGVKKIFREIFVGVSDIRPFDLDVTLK